MDKCPFTNKALEVKVLPHGAAYVESPHGWKSKLLPNSKSAEAWIKSTDLMAVPPEVVEVAGGRWIVRSPVGWTSKLFRDEEDAKEWVTTKPRQRRKKKPGHITDNPNPVIEVGDEMGPLEADA